MINLGDLTARERDIVLGMFLGEEVSILFREFLEENQTITGKLLESSEGLELEQENGWNIKLFVSREPSVLYTNNSSLVVASKQAIKLVSMFS